MCWEDWYKSRKLRSKITILPGNSNVALPGDANRVHVRLATICSGFTDLCWVADEDTGGILMSTNTGGMVADIDIRTHGQVVMAALHVTNSNSASACTVIETFIDEVH